MLRRRLSALASAPAWVRPGAHDYLKDVLESRVYDVAQQTPLQHAPALSSALPGCCNLFLKREDMQPTFSFNLRGAYNKIAHLTPLQKQRGVVAIAAGNHLQVRRVIGRKFTRGERQKSSQSWHACGRPGRRVLGGEARRGRDHRGAARHAAEHGAFGG